MNIDIREIGTASMILFAVIDIIGSLPIIIDLRKKVGHIQSEKASIVSAILMITFLFVGKEILNLIGIDVNSFAVAGSFILFFIALTGNPIIPPHSISLIKLWIFLRYFKSRQVLS